MFPAPLPISDANTIPFEADLFLPVAKPGDTTPYNLRGSSLPGFTPLPGPIIVASFTFTSSQLLATYSAPITLVPAPGIGMTFGFVLTRYDVLPGTNPYIALDGGPQIWFGTAAGTAFDSYALGSLFEEATQQSVVQGTSALSATIVARGGVENLPLVLASPSANMTNGNGIGTLTIAYTIIPLTPS
jgi:hypothetical protein